MGWSLDIAIMRKTSRCGNLEWGSAWPKDAKKPLSILNLRSLPLVLWKYTESGKCPLFLY
jgi:hypothetical protein